MTSQTYNPADEVLQLIAEDRISEDAIVAITEISPEQLQSFLAGSGSIPGMVATRPALFGDEGTRLTVLAAQLTDLSRFNDDDKRLAGIVQVLTETCRLTLDNISRLTGLDLADLEGALEDPQTLPIEKKYQLAIRGSYLLNAVNSAQRR